MPIKLVGDNFRLKHVLMNLVRISLEFGSNGIIEIRAAFNHNEELLKVHVTDTGAGISVSEIAKLSKAFKRKLNDSEKSIEGMNIDLVVCKQVVQHLGGKIDVFAAA